MIQIHTAASGQFSVYVPTYDSELKLIAQSKNLVVDNGLNAVGTQPWASCLQRCLGGSSNVPVTATDTSMGNLVLSSTSAVPNQPACYTLVNIVTALGTPYNMPTLSCLIYRIGRTWKLENQTGITQTIRELGVSITPSGSASLFSRSVVPEFTIEHNKFAYVVYELRLDLGISSATLPFSATTDGNTGFAFPSAAQIGLFNCPVVYLESNGSLQNTLSTAGQAMFEPSTPTYALYYLRSTGGLLGPNPNAGALSATYFTDKRNWFYTNQATLLSGENIASSNPVYTNCHSHLSAHIFANDDNGTYIPGTFKRVRHIIVPPEVPSLNENIYGFAVVNQITAANASQRGLHCYFGGDPWVRPVNTFSKFYFEQTWSAVP